MGLGDERLDRLALGGEPEAVVNKLRVFRNERITDVHRLAVDNERFEIAVRG
ncbi:hypothetical protein D3C83_243200 [compost metagenome]